MKMTGKQSITFENPPYIIAAASVVGKKEGEGPLGKYFDVVEDDVMFGAKTWEEAESTMVSKTISLAISKAELKSKDVRYLVGGDLLGQLIASSFGVEQLSIPMFGVYGACSTMGESIALASILVEGGYADCTLAFTSSHFASAEKQFRFPLGYGNQKPLSMSWTVTGSGAVVLATGNDKNRGKGSKSEGMMEDGTDVVVAGLTPGKIVDYGIKDSMNMGAAMAPSAVETIYQHFVDFKTQPEDYDRIVTGDLGSVGKEILVDMLREKGYDISKMHIDCGMEIYDSDSQDTHAGGSGCGCSAATLTGYILKRMRKRDWNRVLFVPTGALLSTVSFNEGNPVPGIAHAIMLETR